MDRWAERLRLCIYRIVLTFATLSSTSKKSRVTNTKSDQYEPAVYSDKVVWADGRNGDYDIYMYDLSTSTETPMVITGSTQFSPTIYENRIVWEDDRNGNQDIYMYDLSTSIETQITTNESGQCHPAIYGDRIVWIDFRNGDIPDIYMATLVSWQLNYYTYFLVAPRQCIMIQSLIWGNN